MADTAAGSSIIPDYNGGEPVSVVKRSTAFAEFLN
jgi:hypothetical protein